MELATSTNLPEVKYIKLKNGDSIVTMLEYDKEFDISGAMILYNPMKIVSTKGVNESGGIRVLMEKWLPSVIVQEQMCTIFEEDTISIVPVNVEFQQLYTTTVLRTIAIEEMIKNSTDKVAEDVYKANYEDEPSEEETNKFLQNAVKKHRDKLN